MCFYIRQSKTATELHNRFGAKVPQGLVPTPVYNGFAHPLVPAITSRSPLDIELVQWGLVPAWARDSSIQKHTLNARVESLGEKPSFRDVLNNRCLVIADGFYEWKWLDPQGKNKQKYLVTLPGDEAFALAGLWSLWTNPATRHTSITMTIITTEATGLMSQIHNSKNRMPLVLPPDSERLWLEGKDITTFITNTIPLEARAV